MQPVFEIVHDYCSKEDAKVLEGVFLEKFKNEGWNVLNIAKTGSLGHVEVHSKEEVLNEAKKYKSLKDFRNKSSGYYQCGYRSDYWEEIVALFPESKYVKFWTDEEIAKAALQCKTRIEFQKKYKRQYCAA